MKKDLKSRSFLLFDYFELQLPTFNYFTAINASAALSIWTE